MSPEPPLFIVETPSPRDLQRFFDQLSSLLADELAAEQARTALLSTNCSWDVLAERGLAINSLGVSNVAVGLGGKSLITLHRPSAYHTDPAIPSHTFRPGDPAQIMPHESSRKVIKGKKVGGHDKETAVVAEGVIYKISETTVTVAVSPKEGEDFEFPERCRLLKTANTGTFDRMDKAINRVRRLLKVPPSAENASLLAQAAQKLSISKPDESISSSSDAPTPTETDTTAHVVDSPPSAKTAQPVLSTSPHTSIDSAASLSTLPESSRDGQLMLPSSSATPLLKVLFGLAQPTFSPLQNDSKINWFDENLNDSQKEAIKFVFEMNEIACIHGPPGTGKTFTLVEIIRQLVHVQKKRVLVCGASNLSVDNLLLRLSPLFPPQSITRIGHPARVLPALLTRTLDFQMAHSSSGEIVKDIKRELEGHLEKLGKGRKEKGALKGKARFEVYTEVRELRKDFRKRESTVVKSVLNTSEIVLATCHTAGATQLLNQDFDVVIIDEATQALEAVCLVPILHNAKKLILAGDPNQLPPTIISDTSKSRKPKEKKQNPPKAQRRAKDVKTSPSTSIDTANSTAEVDAFTLESMTAEEEKVDAGPDAALSEKEDDDEGSTAKPSNKSSDAPSASPRRSRLRPPRSLEETLFQRLERIYGPGIKRMLTVQYRMNSSIASYPSDALYMSALVSAPSVASRTLSDLPSFSADLSDDAKEFLDPPVVFLDTSGCEFFERTNENGGGEGRAGGGGSTLNENEAEVVRNYVEKLIQFGIAPEDIGVLAAYQAQVSLLSSLLKATYPGLLIGTVDSLQGQEREAIVLSLVRSNEKREVGFLVEERRLNVAMTRAKRQLCVVGDSSTVASGSAYLKAWMNWLEDHAEVRFAGDIEI